MQPILLVGAGGFLGAVARYGASCVLRSRFGESFPVATLTVNVVGCLLIGILVGLARDATLLSDGARLFVVVGLLGSFTTFSTFGHETFELLTRGEVRTAFASVAANFGLGLAAVWIGVLCVGGSVAR